MRLFTPIDFMVSSKKNRKEKKKKKKKRKTSHLTPTEKFQASMTALVG